MYPVIRAKNRKCVLLQREYTMETRSLDIRENAMGTKGYDTLEYLYFPKLEEIKQIKHMFTTRMGGVSKGHLASLNLSYTRGDLSENVLENYRRVGRALGCSEKRFVASHQTHTTNIRVVSAADAGKGVVRDRDYDNIDGLVTDVPGLALACFFADCVPLYFVDPLKQVIGLAHSGWRGTAAGMGACMVEKMQQTYGCNPEDIVAAIGPSICRDCYEISEEVAEEFRQGFWADEKIKTICEEIKESGIYCEKELLIPGKEPGKYQLDLWLANLIVLKSAGIRTKNVDIADICTCCNPDYLYSHRASKGMRGNLAAFLVLQDNCPGDSYK